MYPDIEHRYFYPQLNGLSKIIKKDYLKIQGTQRSHKNCVKQFFSELLGRLRDPFIFFSFPFLFFPNARGKHLQKDFCLFFFLSLKDLQTILTTFRGNQSFGWSKLSQLHKFARNKSNLHQQPIMPWLFLSKAAH